jgi:DNA-binding transcriptional LysR family regulator
MIRMANARHNTVSRANARLWIVRVERTNTNKMIQAAISGQGVALGPRPLLSDLIESGALVAPFNASIDAFAVGACALRSALDAGSLEPAISATWRLRRDLWHPDAINQGVKPRLRRRRICVSAKQLLLPPLG